MKNEVQRIALAVALGVAFAMPSSAHHSTAAEFDQNKPITFIGTVEKVMWMNPHIYTHIAVKPPDGPAVTYRVEGGSPNTLFRQGWRKDSLKAGESVTVNGWRAKNPESLNIGQATITTAAGRKVFSGQGPASEGAQ